MEIQFSDCVKSYSDEDTKVILENFETIRNQHEINPKETIILNAKDFPISSSQFEKIFQKYKNESEDIDKKIKDYLGCPNFARKMLQKLQTKYILDADIFVNTVIKKMENLDNVFLVNENIIQIICGEPIFMNILHDRIIKLTDKTEKILLDNSIKDSFHIFECSEDEFYIEVRKKLLQLGLEIIQIIIAVPCPGIKEYTVYLKVL